MPVIFESSKLKIEYIVNDEDTVDYKRYEFKVCLKDFDTPDLYIEYDDIEKVLVRTWIKDEESENPPKNHIVYKMFNLIEYEVLEIVQFLIKHM